MKKIIPIFFCALFFNSVKSECDNSKCASEIVGDILNDTTVFENIDIKLEVPNFKQIKNVGIEDLNKILLHLTSWFENRLNDTNFVFKHVSNKTKIFVKSFDFNVDFEKGNAKIDVDLTEEPNDKKKGITTEEIETTTPKILTTTENLKQKQIEKTINKTEQINRLISKLGSEKSNELFRLDEFDTSYYDSNEDNSTDYPIIDYVDIYKDTTNEENVYIPTTISPTIDDTTGVTESELNFTAEIYVPRPTSDPDSLCHGDEYCQEFTRTVFPWIATIFVTDRNQENRFSYFCDGVLLTEKVIVTDARCLISGNKTSDPDNMLVFLGKVNLQSFGGNEKVHKVYSVVMHPNFTVFEDGRVTNDLALIVLEESVEFTENIKSACIHQENSIAEAATTAWGLDGALVPIFFNREKGEYCFDKDEDIFCATYGNDVAFCPSYGGIFASRQEGRWCLSGIFYGDPADRGICFTKNVHYTSLTKYLKWIDDSVGMFKNGIL